jgi:hypothetical protein
MIQPKSNTECSAGFARFPFAECGREAGQGKHPPVECVNPIEPGSRRAADIHSYYPCVIADRRIVRRIFVSDVQDLCYRCLGSQKGGERGRKRGGHGLRDPLGSRRSSVLVARRSGGASSHVHARWRRRPRSESERKAARNVTARGSFGCFRGQRRLHHCEPP